MTAAYVPLTSKALEEAHALIKSKFNLLKNELRAEYDELSHKKKSDDDSVIATSWDAFYEEKKSALMKQARLSLKDSMPDVDAAMTQRDLIVNNFLATWAANPHSPLVAPYVDAATGQVKLCDYMRDQGLVIAGTTIADLTYYQCDPTTKFNNVQIFNASIQGQFLINSNTTNLNIVSCNIDEVMIGGNDFHSPVQISNSSFSLLSYNTVMFMNTLFTDCDFIDPQTFSPPTLDTLTQTFVSQLAQVPYVPTSSILQLRNCHLRTCNFQDYPLSNLWADSVTFDSCNLASGLDQTPTFWGVFGVTGAFYSISAATIPQYGLMLAGNYPDGCSFQRASTCLFLADLVTLRNADFSFAKITFSAQNSSSTKAQSLSTVDLTGANFTGATVSFANSDYQGEDIKTLLTTKLGVSQAMADTMTFTAPENTLTDTGLSDTATTTKEAGLFAKSGKQERKESSLDKGKNEDDAKDNNDEDKKDKDTSSSKKP